MLSSLRERLHDPDRTIAHRALRVALVMPLLFAFGLHGLGDGQFALVAAFGVFSALAMADFTGPQRSRLAAHIGLCLIGTVLVTVGTALSNTLWPAVIAMLVIGVTLQFAAALGGQIALGINAAILAFVVAVMVPAGNETIPSRVGGWIAAMACATIAAMLLWPRHERRDLYQRVADACRPLAAVAHAVAQGNDPGTGIADAQAAIERVRDAQRTLGFRPIGPPGQQPALLGLIDALTQAWRFSGAAVATAPLSPNERELARAVATTLDAVADVLQCCADSRRGAGPDIDVLVAARHAHRALLDTAATAALAGNARAATVISTFHAVFPLRVLSFIALSMAADAIVLTGRSVRIDDDFGVLEPTAAEGAVHHAASVLTPHLSLESVWLRNSLRAGLALALSVLIAKISDIGHAFWVVLATLTVLRSNAVTTGSTVISAVGGTLAGFVLATLVIIVFGSSTPLLWAALPVAVFLAAYGAGAVSFGAGQAMFAVLVVLLFNLIVPAGWETGVVRLEAETVGAVVALAASLIMWPTGASTALRAEVAAHVRAGRRVVELAFDGMLGRADANAVDAARDAVLRARHRVEEALAAYAGERGAKRVPLDVWVLLCRIPVTMRLSADAAIVVQRSGYGGVDCPAASRLLGETVSALGASFGEIADRLDAPQRVPDPALRALIADLDMVAGEGSRRAAIAAATAACIDAHSGAAADIPRMMVLTWAACWMSYLAHIRGVAEPALEEVLTHADTPWWR